jgi:hypothetical protein
MDRIEGILKDRRGGTSFPLAIAITLALIIIFAGVSEYLRLMIIAKGVRDAVQSSVIATVTENYDNVYQGAREGYSGAYQPMGGGFDESLDYGDIYRRLSNILGLTRSGGYYIKTLSDGSIEFMVWGLSVDIQNAPFARSDSAAERFVADCTIQLEAPVSFGGKILPPMRITVKTGAGYTPKF